MGQEIRPFELDPTTNLAVEVVPSDRCEGEEEPAFVERPRKKSTNWLGWLYGSSSLALFLVLITETVQYVRTLLLEAPILGLALTVLVVLAVGAAVGGISAEILALRKLRRHENIHRQAARIADSSLHGEAAPLMANLIEDYRVRPDLRGALRTYQQIINDAHNDRETLVLFERNVLRQLDRQAYRIVLASSRDIGIITALSPLGLIDSALVLVRALMMLRAIARLYGVRPGTVATFALLRRCIRNAALAGLTDLVTDAAVETTGASLASMVSARAGQGMGNGLLAGRLGLEAIKVTRPLPFIEEEQPRLRHIRQSLFDKRADD